MMDYRGETPKWKAIADVQTGKTNPGDSD